MVSNKTVNDVLILYPDCFGGTVRISTSIHESNKYSDVAFAAVILLLGPATGMLNLLTLLAIFKNRNLQTVPNIIVTSLCITDMLTGFIAEPLYFTMNVLGTTRSFKKTVTVSTVVYFGAIYLITISYVTQIVLWTERYIGIFQPYFYRKWCTKCFFAKFLVVLWIFFLIIHSATYFITSWDVLTYFALASFPIALSWCFYVQLKTFCLVKQIRREIRAVAALHSRTSGIIGGHRSAISGATKVGMSISIAMLLCYAPNFFLYFLERLKFISHITVLTHCSWTNVLLMFNSLLNVLIYCIRLRGLRAIIMSYVGCL